MRTKLEIPAARKADFQNILLSFQFPPELNDHSVHCCACGEEITWDNLGGVLVQNGKLILFCDLSDCIEKNIRVKSNPST